MLLDLIHSWEMRMLIPPLSTRRLVQLVFHDSVDSSQGKKKILEAK